MNLSSASSVLSRMDKGPVKIPTLAPKVLLANFFVYGLLH